MCLVQHPRDADSFKKLSDHLKRCKMNRQSNILEEPTGSRPTQLPEVSFGHKLHILETFYHNGVAEGKSESSKSSV